jgi:hypothetical protein
LIFIYAENLNSYFLISKKDFIMGKYSKKTIIFSVFFLLISCLSTDQINKKESIQNTTFPMTRAGINWGFPHKGREDYVLFKEFGITWLRVDFFWDVLEPAQGEWKLEETDYFLKESEKMGHNILGLLLYDTPWIHDNPEGLREVTGDQIDDFLNYVEVIVTRYKDQVDEWEIWNEPNLFLNKFWTASDEDFFKLISAASAKIREIDPDAVILGGALYRFDKGYIRKMYKAGALEHIDVFSYHPYYDNPVKINKKSRDLESHLRQLGFQGGFRVTEAGFNTYGSLPTSSPPEEQGRDVLETLLYLGTFDHPYLIWYNLYNDTTEGTGFWFDKYGLMIKDGDTLLYKTGGWALRRYNELIADSYPSGKNVNIENSLKKKIFHSLYWDGVNSDQQTLVLLGEKKVMNLVLTGFEKGSLFNAATGEVSRVHGGDIITLTYSQPYIITLENVTHLSLSVKSRP